MRADRDRTPIRHCVTRVNRQIKYGELELARVNCNRPKILGELESHLDIATKTAVQKLSHPADLILDINGQGLQLLPP